MSNFKAMFTKPKSINEATKYLFVGNCGPKLGFSLESIKEIFSPFGKILDIHIPEPEKSHIFITYETIESASKAKEYFQDKKINNRQFSINFATIPKKTQNQEEKEITVYNTTEECMISGLKLINNFISEIEETNILSYLKKDTEDWENHCGRQVKHYGILFDYSMRNIDRTRQISAIPDILKPIINRIENLDIISEQIDQLTVNVYPPGTGLGSHIDTHSAFTGAIFSLTTGFNGLMEFRKDDIKIRLKLSQRSLLIMNGESRYIWEHHIPRQNGDLNAIGTRISFTFRKARGFECDCQYPKYCDSQDLKLPPTRLAEKQKLKENENLQKLEDEYVHKVYGMIARHFSSTRFAIWPKVREFIMKIKPGSIIADLGCGNGKYFNIRKDIAIIGIDRSQDLLELAMKKHYPIGLSHKGKSIADVNISDCLNLPLKSESMDSILCIAVLHHISSEERRLKVLKEALRILKPNGTGIITVWATQQENPQKTIEKWKLIEKSDYFVPWNLPLHRVEGQSLCRDMSEMEKMGVINDFSVNDEKSAIVLKRYYHLYEENELELLLLNLKTCEITNSYYDKSNWCVEFVKK